MKKSFKSFLSSIIIIVLLMPFFAIPGIVSADGLIIKPGYYDYDRWEYLKENSQQAFINYEDGLEKMILSISLSETNENAVWIFPVPTEPSKVAVDVVGNLPQLIGKEAIQLAKTNLVDIKSALFATQIYTIPFIPFYYLTSSLSADELGALPRATGTTTEGIETDVTVYEHLEKEGITTEIITAKDAQALYQYLQGKDLEIKQGSISVLDYYVGKEFTFVVSWISKESPSLLSSSESEINQNLLYNLITPYYRSSNKKQKGLFVIFPTKKIYYPLLPTSVYESEVIPATIRIIGHSSPKIFNDIKSFTKIEYYINGHINFRDELRNFYSGPFENIKYTKIEINAPSKFLTDDLWINPRMPLKTFYYSFIAQQPLISGILLLILSSVITGIVAGYIAFKDLRNKNGILKLGLVGLSNCLSIIGILIITPLIKTKYRDEDGRADPLLDEVKQKGYVWKRRLAFFLSVINLLFLAIIILGSLENPFIYGSMQNYLITFRPVALFVSTIVLAFAAAIKKIKPEDGFLFDQLKLAGYSSWSFQPKDRMKFLFVPLFSVLFLATTWLIIKLVEFTI